MRLRLKKRALDTQKLVNKAMELGLIDNVKRLQDMNLKVFTLLNIPIGDIPKAKLSPPKYQVQKEQASSIFDLTGGD